MGHIDRNGSTDPARAPAIEHEASRASHMDVTELKRSSTIRRRAIGVQKDRPRVAFYVRAGSVRPRNDLARQLRSCRSARSQMVASTAVSVFADHGRAHAAAARPDFKALMEAAQARAFDTLLIEDPDRLSRDQGQLDWIFGEFAKPGVTVVTTDQRCLRRENVILQGMAAPVARAARRERRQR